MATSIVQAERFTEQAVAEVLQLLLYWTMGIALPSGIFAVAFFLPHSRYCPIAAGEVSATRLG